MPIFTKRLNFNNTNRDSNWGHRVGGLFADAGDLTGTTAMGDANGDGTVFDVPSIDRSDAGTPAILASSFNGTAGAYPVGGLIDAADADGNVSGTAIGTFANTDTDTAASAASDATFQPDDR
jgi:hypothetical protein